MYRPLRACAPAIVVALSSLSLVATSVRASEQSSLMPLEDTYSRELDPTATFGSGGGLHVSGATATNALGGMYGVVDSWMRFDTSSAVAQFDAAYGAGQWTLESVVLSVRENASPGNSELSRGTGDFGVSWIASDNWAEGTGASSNPGTASGNQIGWTYGQSILSAADRGLGVFQNAGNNTRQDFSLALDGDFVADLLAGGSTTLRLTAASDEIGFTFSSSNNGNAGNRPNLILTAVPEPATAAMLLCVGMAAIRRRR